MSHETYTFIHRRISKALAPELSDEEALEAADEDWAEDLRGADPAEGMPFEQCARRPRPRARWPPPSPPA